MNRNAGKVIARGFSQFGSEGLTFLSARIAGTIVLLALCLNSSVLAESPKAKAARSSSSSGLPAAFSPSSPSSSSSSSSSANSSSSAPAKPENKVLKGGIISSIGNAGTVRTVSTPAQGDEQSPISGSISFDDDTHCSAKVINTSDKDSYSVSYQVTGTDERGSVPLRASYSASLKPKQTVTNRVSCKRELNMQVVLKSGKKTN